MGLDYPLQHSGTGDRRYRSCGGAVLPYMVVWSYARQGLLAHCCELLSLSYPREMEADREGVVLDCVHEYYG